MLLFSRTHARHAEVIGKARNISQPCTSLIFGLYIIQTPLAYFQYLIHETWIRGLIIFLYVVIFVLSVVGNALVILVVVKERSMQARKHNNKHSGTMTKAVMV